MTKRINGFIIGTLVLILLCIFFIDRPLAVFMDVIPISIKRIGKGLTHLIEPSTVLVILPLSLLFIKKSQLLYFRITSLILSLSVSLALTSCLKLLFTRSRPDLFINAQHFSFFNLQFSSNYYSFPSSHATAAGALAMGLSLIFPKYQKPLLVIGALLALTRVITNQHFLSDVIAGFFIGALSAYLLVFKTEGILPMLWNQIKKRFK